MMVVAIICVLYLVPQFQGAGLTLNILLGVPDWVGVAVVGVIVIANVVGGGMRSITFVQAFQYWLKLTAVAIPALVLILHFFGDRSRGRTRPVPADRHRHRRPSTSPPTSSCRSPTRWR